MRLALFVTQAEARRINGGADPTLGAVRTEVDLDEMAGILRTFLDEFTVARLMRATEPVAIIVVFDHAIPSRRVQELPEPEVPPMKGLTRLQAEMLVTAERLRGLHEIRGPAAHRVAGNLMARGLITLQHRFRAGSLVIVTDAGRIFLRKAEGA